MENPLLSICIPTFNRAPLLKDCLESITSQLTNDLLKSQIEVVISDNASSDNTAEIVSGYQKNFQNIKYFRNETNLGFDRNILEVVEKSTGEYCLTLGDDDGLLPNGLVSIIKKIQDHSVEQILLTNWEYDKTLNSPITKNPNVPEKEDNTYFKLQDYIKEQKNNNSLVGIFGGMSTHLFKRKIWKEFSDKDIYINSEVIHLFILLRAYMNFSFVVINEPYIKTRNDNMRWEVFPGLANIDKRTDSTITTTLWINRTFKLGLSPTKIKLRILKEKYIIILKNVLKKMLKIFGLRK